MSIDGISIQFGEFSLFIHQTIFSWYFIGIIVCAVLVWAGKKFKEADPTKAPKGVVLVFEQIALMAQGIIGENLQKKTWKYLPFMGSMMIMMVVSNLFGLLSLQAPTSNLSITLTLVLIIFFLIHGTNLKDFGVKSKLKAWLEPMPVLLPLNILGDLAFPLSLSLRLFGNLLGGTVIMLLLYSFIESLLPFTVLAFTVTPFLHLYFDVFTAFIQTFIFFTLASYFLSDAIDLEKEN